MSLKFCIIIESNSPKTFFAIVLYTNLAAVTSGANQELGSPLMKSLATAFRDKKHYINSGNNISRVSSLWKLHTYKYIMRKIYRLKRARD